MAPAPVTWNGGEPCRLAAPHSSAHIDLNGDCVADLFLVCERGAYQIWTARRDVPLTYDLAQSGTLPPGAAAVRVPMALDAALFLVHYLYTDELPPVWTASLGVVTAPLCARLGVRLDDVRAPQRS